MAKIKHNDFNETINDLLIEAENRGVIRLNCESENWKGSSMVVGQQEMLNFGTCGYMALENHPAIIEKAIEYTRRFGTQFSVSRTYLVSKDSLYLEELLSEIFSNKKVITYSSTTLLHTSVLPCVVGSNDFVILDQQCHASIQTAAQIVHAKGVPLDVIRHSNMEMLEHIIQQNRDKYEKIWYMVDGIYSMFGDLATINEINELMKKYPQLHLYMDDAHGMSWSGKHGCGRMFEETLKNERTIYVTTMAKGFGAMGGIVVFPNEKWFNKVKIYGGALTHSHPISPPMLGASIASAQLHLSDEIYDLQTALREKIDYTNQLLAQTNLPVISNLETPIYFIGTGQPSVGYNMNKRVLDAGFYVNIGMFPAVPIKNTGLRFTVTNHNSKDDIKKLISTLEEQYPLALEEENKVLGDVQKAFKINTTKMVNNKKETDIEFEIISENSIVKINRDQWNNLFENRGHFDYDSLALFEKAFSDNNKIENNWDFHYIVIKDDKEDIVLATFLTSGVIKDDMLSSEDISINIEEKRKTDPYFLCSKTLMMGSLFTEGNHLYLNKNHVAWEKALAQLLKIITEIQESQNINSVLLRDFDEDDLEIEKIFHDHGYFKFSMPNSNVITDLNTNKDNFIHSLSARSRRHIKEDVLSKIDLFNVKVESSLDDTELKRAYELYMEVASKNKAINLFNYPFKLFLHMNDDENWEFIKLLSGDKLLGVGICHKSKHQYNPVLVGIDYYYNYKLNTYKQMLFQVCMRAIDLGYQQINFGFSADIEKRKLGAKQSNKFAYLHIEDQFNAEVLEMYKQKQTTALVNEINHAS